MSRWVLPKPPCRTRRLLRSTRNLIPLTAQYPQDRQPCPAVRTLFRSTSSSPEVTWAPRGGLPPSSCPGLESRACRYRRRRRGQSLAPARLEEGELVDSGLRSRSACNASPSSATACLMRQAVSLSWSALPTSAACSSALLLAVQDSAGASAHAISASPARLFPLVLFLSSHSTLGRNRILSRSAILSCSTADALFACPSRLAAPFPRPTRRRPTHPSTPTLSPPSKPTQTTTSPIRVPRRGTAGTSSRRDRAGSGEGRPSRGGWELESER